jgi:hypothetical protein
MCKLRFSEHIQTNSIKNKKARQLWLSGFRVLVQFEIAALAVFIGSPQHTLGAAPAS